VIGLSELVTCDFSGTNQKTGFLEILNLNPILYTILMIKLHPNLSQSIPFDARIISISSELQNS